MSADKVSVNIPITNTITYTVTSYQVDSSITVTLNQMATVHVLFYTDSNVTYSRTVNLTGADYDAWGVDDTYIYTYVANNIMAIFNSGNDPTAPTA